MSTSEGQRRCDGLEKKHEARLCSFGHVQRKDDGYQVYWEMDADGGAARKEEAEKA